MSDSETPEVTPADLPVFDLGPATRRLIDVIAADPDHTPCRAGRIWTSRDPGERALAATFCREHCPHLYLCEEAADEEPAEAIDGVWAGVDRRPRRTNKRRTKT